MLGRIQVAVFSASAISPVRVNFDSAQLSVVSVIAITPNMTISESGVTINCLSSSSNTSCRRTVTTNLLSVGALSFVSPGMNEILQVTLRGR